VYVCVCFFVFIVTMEIFMFYLYIIYTRIVIIQNFCKGQGRGVKNKPTTKIPRSFTPAFLQIFNLHGDASGNYTLTAVKGRLTLS
jgi:hypothetical protein